MIRREKKCFRNSQPIPTTRSLGRWGRLTTLSGPSQKKEKSLWSPSPQWLSKEKESNDWSQLSLKSSIFWKRAPRGRKLTISAKRNILTDLLSSTVVREKSEILILRSVSRSARSRRGEVRMKGTNLQLRDSLNSKRLKIQVFQSRI